MKSILVLGTESEFRKMLMNQAGYTYEIVKPQINEQAIRHDAPHELVKLLGKAKSDAVATKLEERGKDFVIVTSDQIMYNPVTGDIYEKPLTCVNAPYRARARKYFIEASKNPLKAVTSLVVASLSTNYRSVQSFETEISLSPFTDSELEIMLDDPITYASAGACIYGVEGNKASEIYGQHITQMNGERSNLIGLHMPALKKILSALGYSAR